MRAAVRPSSAAIFSGAPQSLRILALQRRRERVEPASCTRAALTRTARALRRRAPAARRARSRRRCAPSSVSVRRARASPDRSAVADVVAVRFQPLQDVRERLGDVQIAGADVRLARRVVVEDERDVLVAIRLALAARRTAPRAAPPIETCEAIGLRTTMVRPVSGSRHLLLAADDRRRDRAGQLRHRHLEGAFEHRQPHRRLAPLLLAAAVEADQVDDRDVDLREQPSRRRAPRS